MPRTRSRLVAALTASVALSGVLLVVVPGQASAVTEGVVVSSPSPYPFLGYLEIRRSRLGFANGGKDCGATLIAPDYAITAAHCLQDAEDGKGKKFSASEATVTFGKTSRSGSGGEERSVSRFLRPDFLDYDDPNVNDVAILKLSSPVNSIRPAPLAICGSTPIRSVFSAGWGRGDTTLADSLREANLRLIDGVPPSGTKPYQYQYTTSFDGTPESGTMQIGDSGTGLFGRTPSGEIVLTGVLYAFGDDTSGGQVQIWVRVDIGSNQTDFISQNTQIDDLANGCQPRF